MCQNIRPNTVIKISRVHGYYNNVQTRYSTIIYAVETQMQLHMTQVCDIWAALKAACEVERQSTSWNTEPLSFCVRNKEESRILKVLTGGMRDVVWRNAALLEVAGLIYQDFRKAFKGDYWRRVEKCIQILILMFKVRTHFKRSAGTGVTDWFMTGFTLVKLCSGMCASSCIVQPSLATRV